MRHFMNISRLMLLAMGFMAIPSAAKLSDLHCGACHMLVDEISWEISQTDPKKTIQVGSFRIMPDGSQRLNEIPYKQSGVQLSELLDTACGRPNDYYQTKDEASGRTVYKRQNRRDGKPASLTNLSLSKDTIKMLKFACEGIAEDFEESIINAFKDTKEDNYLNRVCVQIAGVCTTDQLYDVNPEIAEIDPLPERSKDEGSSEEKDSSEEEDDDEKSSSSHPEDSGEVVDLDDINNTGDIKEKTEL